MWWLLLAEGGLQLWSGFEQAELIREQTELQQNMNELNAQFAEYDAWEAEKFGYEQGARYRAVVDAAIGEQRVGYAAQGVDVNYGTAAEVQEDSRINGYLNALDVQRAARYRAYGLGVQASNLRLQGRMIGIEGNLGAFGARTRGITGAVGSGAQAYAFYNRDY